MTYLLDRNKKRKNIKLFFSIVLFLIVIIFWSPVKKFSYPIVEPVLTFVVSVKDFIFLIPKNIVIYFHSKNYYDERVKNLEQNVEDLENKLAINEEIIRSQNLLKDVKDIKKIIVANPVLRDPTSIYNTVILSKGFSDGINISYLVYIRGMEPVGKIEKVHSKTSELNLFSASGNKIDGVLINEKIIPLVGTGGGNFIANLPKDFAVNVGDNIYYATKGYGLLGTVSDIQNDIQDTYSKVYIKGTYNPMNVNNFYIEKND